MGNQTRKSKTRMGKLQMFLHAEDLNKVPVLKDKDLTAVVRIGNDFINNQTEQA